MKTNETKNNEEELKEPKDQPRTSQEEPAETDGQTGSEEAEQPSELEQTQQQLEELKDKFLRLSAEFDNYRKRTLKEKAELVLNGSEKTISSILPVLDDMERALKNMDKMEDLDAVKKGVDLIYQKFVKVLGDQGVKKIDTENADFNIDLHEAIAQVPAPSDEMKGKVIDCVKSGYTLNEKVIRHAQVAVGL